MRKRHDDTPIERCRPGDSASVRHPSNVAIARGRLASFEPISVGATESGIPCGGSRSDLIADVAPFVDGFKLARRVGSRDSRDECAVVGLAHDHDQVERLEHFGLDLGQ